MNYFKFNVTDSSSDIQRKTVNILTTGLTIVGVIMLGLVILFDMTGLSYTWSVSERSALYLGTTALVVITPILFLINQRAHRVAGWLLLVYLLYAAVASDDLDRVTERGLIIFVMPIVIASTVLKPWTAFVVAGLSSFIVTIVQLLFLREPVPNFITIVAFFAIALISYLDSENKERALNNVQEVNVQLDVKNAQLDAKLKAQQQHLIQLINEFAFFENNQQNAIVLFGPDKRPIFSNKIAQSTNDHMDDEVRSIYEAVVEKAWEKNVYTHVKHNGHQVDVSSFLIDTDEGQYLLLQAMRLPDEKHSIEDWQQKLNAISNLPENSEFESRTRRMRATVSKNGNFNKKILFELDPDGIIIIENPLNRDQKLSFNLKDLLALAIRNESQ